MMNSSEKRYYDKNGIEIKRVYTIPVGELSIKEAEENIKKLMKEYKEYEYGDYWFPSKDDTNIEFLESELTEKEKEEREISEKTGFVDWNQYDLDYLADYLDSKYLFSSSGEAFAIMRMVDFYRAHKDLKNK